MTTIGVFAFVGTWILLAVALAATGVGWVLDRRRRGGSDAVVTGGETDG